MPENGRIFECVYHDTSGRRLARAGATLSRRTERGRSVWSLRVPRPDGAPLDLEADGGPAAPPQIMRLLGAFLREEELEEALKLRIRRYARQDEVEVLEGLRHKDTFSVKAGGERAAALELLDGEPPPSERDPAGRLRALLGRQYTEILRHDPSVRLALDPEDLHRMRVAVRRARAILRAVRTEVGAGWSEPLRTELKWLGGVLGPRRDLDVLLARLREQIGALEEPERSAAGPLVASLEAERGRAQAHVAEALASDRYAKLLDALEEGTRTLEAPRDLSLNRIAAREFQRLRKKMKALGVDASDEELHRARILGRRARYAAELAEADAGKKAGRFIAKAKAFQDVLGSHQDAIVAEARLRELLGGARGARAGLATGRLVERERMRRRDARRALPKAWTKLERRGRRAWS